MAPNVPTYSLAAKPNLIPSEVELGTLITNPTEPDSAFYTSPSWTIQKTTRAPKPFACKISDTKGSKIGFFASFAALLSGSLTASHSSFVGKFLCAQSMQEESFRPDAAFLQALSLNADVQNHLTYSEQNVVWLITGVKIGWNVWIANTTVEWSEVAGKLEGSAAAAGVPLQIGLSGQRHAGKSLEVYYYEPGPVVFGVEVMKLKTKGDGSFGSSAVAGQFYGRNDGKPAKAIQLVPCGDEEPDFSLTAKADGYDETTGEDFKLLLVEQ
jgi:hypothetical protein